ncbi:MAG: GAF domain-containing sensor histidine kinase, partial [Chloroflexota bacterium]|nr:GAF domain-containing sensor histidine kinase [Chloroflexota bacterium]
RIPVGMYRVGQIAQQRRAFLTNLVSEDHILSNREWATCQGLVAFAGHPLVIEERLVGVLALFAHNPLEESALSALRSVADRIALGIDRKRVEEELHRSLDSLLVLHESGRILGTSLKLDELGPRLLEIVQRVVGVSAAVLSLRSDDAQLVVGYTGGPESVWRRARDSDAARAAYHWAIERGQPEGFRLDLPGPVPLRLAAWCLPLVAHGETIGMLEAYGPPSLEDEETVELLVSLAYQAAGALENARLYEALAERERRLEQLVGKLLTAQEEERRRVSYEVHDGLAQTATAAHQHLQAYAHSHMPRSSQARQELGTILELVRHTVGDARRVIADLRPTELDDFGLVAAIKLQVDALHALGWDIHLEENLGAERLSPTLETALLRVAQEALRNARKHSGADRAHVKIERGSSALRLEVKDWGRGFDPDEVAVSSGPGERVGLAGMRERIRLLGGELTISSITGEGTTVVALVPLSQEGG